LADLGALLGRTAANARLDLVEFGDPPQRRGGEPVAWWKSKNLRRACAQQKANCTAPSLRSFPANL
jgi:hypothetical protein